MPELPEMETYRHHLLQTVAGKVISDVAVLREKTINVTPASFAAHVTHRRMVDVDRRGKHLIFWLDSDEALLLHLMLGGWLYYGSVNHQPSHPSQVVITFADGRQLFFLGLGLGYLHLMQRETLAAKLSGLGPEPLLPDFTFESFSRVLIRKRGPLKFALVDQHVLAGIGNCYSDEICFEAGVHPLTRTADINAGARQRLFTAIPSVLRRAISLGGYMEFPFQTGDTLTGGYNTHCLVYDHGGEPCPRCGLPIVRTEHSGRKVFYCAHCQPEPGR